MKNILFLDTETTGFDHEKDAVVEVAYALWSVPHRSMIDCRSFLIDSGQPNAAEHVNRIPDAMIRNHGRDWGSAQEDTARAISRADIVVAYNAEFDRGWFDEKVAEVRPWVCACDDIEWPTKTKSRSLIDVAIGHDVGVVHAHRAMSDVMLLVRLFESVARHGADIEAMLVRAMRPKARYLSLAPFSQKDEVKAAGFHWIDDGREKGWFRNMAIEDAETLPFGVTRKPKVKR